MKRMVVPIWLACNQFLTMSGLVSRFASSSVSWADRAKDKSRKRGTRATEILLATAHGQCLSV